MCGIAGFYNAFASYTSNIPRYTSLLEDFCRALINRGPDEQGVLLGKSFGFAHTRLAIIDLTTGTQPMVRSLGDKKVSIVYNGELYNTAELRSQLSEKGHRFVTTSDTEVILAAYIEYGCEAVKMLNGIFAFAVMDERDGALYLFRDRSGVKPLFYHVDGATVTFASEIKALFCSPNIVPQLDISGLNEVFGIGPAKTSGSGVFKGVSEVLPGHFIRCSGDTIRQECYWRLVSGPHTDSLSQTIEKTRFLVHDAISRQMVSDVPICTFLSGGVDSSIVSAVCAEQLKAQGKRLTTFSFDFADNNKNFKSSLFQPSQDRPYVEKMVEFLGSEHHYLECTSKQQAELLTASVDARDLPAMADVDSSLLYFCSVVKDYNKVVLTGECADEIFGGYPWFHKQEFFLRDSFPWTPSLDVRKSVLSDEFLSKLRMDDYVQNAYHRSLLEVPTLASDTPTEAKRREIAYLNLRWFMQTLLDRMDRTSMHSGLEARVPFADHRIIEYAWNVPWEMKSAEGVEKSLLREAARGMLPDEVLFRKKSPYPKTYDPGYEAMLKTRLTEILEDSSSPILKFVDKSKAYTFMSTPASYGKPWYGQLMAGPQMLAYLIQVNYWLEKFNPTLCL